MTAVKKALMITGIIEKNQTKITIQSMKTNNQWQQALATAVRDPLVLVDLLQLPPLPALSLAAAEQFSLLVPHSYLQRIRLGDWHDPLLRQVLPMSDELQLVDGFGIDPVGDSAAMVAEGVLHKYNSRVLLISTAACAIHCRYCFRRHFPYAEAQAGRDQWRVACDYLAAHPEVDEVILSGGDPLVLSDQRLQWLLQALAKQPHLQRIRIHTRLPIVLPERITEGLLQLLQQTSMPIVMVLHANHAQELDAVDVKQAIQALQLSGVLLLNQAVLLRGVNDSVAALRALSEELIAQRVLPYYLHLLDKVAGAAHFEVPEDEAQALMARLRAEVSGYLVPQLVKEVAYEASKTPVMPFG